MVGISALAIDTHKIVKRLREAGFSEPQGGSRHRPIQEAAAIDLSHLATKADLAETKAELLKWMSGMIGGALLVNILAMLGAMYGLAKLLGALTRSRRRTGWSSWRKG